MCDGAVTVLPGCLVSPALHGGPGYFDGVSALAADKVVVEFLTLASAVFGFAVMAAKCVHVTIGNHGLEEPVDRSEGERFPGGQQLGVQLLGALELAGAFQHLFQG